jgi:predicted O-methyltransferase YrrM
VISSDGQSSTPPSSALFHSGFATPILEDRPDLIAETNFISRRQVLEICMHLAMRVPGHVMEFGVATGASTRIIRRALNRARMNPFLPHRRKKIYACDSFEGLREDFENAKAGTFAGRVPSISGVNFVKGYFETTLTPQLRDEIGKVAFAHLDADLYTSTIYVLTWLTPLLDVGSLLLFDEFIGEFGAERQAFEEWRTASGLSVVRLAEFDRDPSGYGTQRPDRRVLFQVLRGPTLEATPVREFRSPRGSLHSKVSYYLGRLGLHELKSRLDGLP